uniref:RNA-directed DNA polymerase n=1 Tax=Trichuris muris TaxID=70415 RepID=A0A5S6R443_TRIMR
MRIARWATLVLPFAYTVRYKPGSLNVVADALSRLPAPCTDGNEDNDIEMVAQISKDLLAVKYDDFVEATKNCPVLRQVIACVENGWPIRLKNVEDQLLLYFRTRWELAVQNGCLIRGNHRIVVLQSLQALLISLAHETHQEIIRTKARLRELYWWPAMHAQVELFVRNCSTCQQMDKTVTSFHPPLQPVPLPSAEWEKLGIDIVGPLNGMPYTQRFAVTMIDYYSKWPEVYFYQRATTKDVLNFLHEVFSREGYPTEVVTDNGTQFTSYEFKRFLKECGIRHCRTSLYYPQANGEIERFNRVLKDTLQAATIGHLSKADTVMQFLMIYRATPHCVTGEMPSLLLHGRTLQTKLHATMMPDVTDDHIVRFKVLAKQDYMRPYADRRKKLRLPDLTPEDTVRARQPGSVTKPRYSQPLTVQRQVGRATYKLCD